MSTRDPVCGKEVDPLRARAVGIFGGMTYFFCSAECKSKYADPRARPATAPPEGQPERRKKSSPFAAPGSAGPAASVATEPKAPARNPSGKFPQFEATPLPAPISAAELAPLDAEELPARAAAGLPWRFILPALALGALLALVLVLRR